MPARHIQAPGGPSHPVQAGPASEFQNMYCSPMFCRGREFFAIFAICFFHSRTFFVAIHRMKPQAAEVIYS